MDQIEESASALGYGPLVECTTVTNFSVQQIFCRMCVIWLFPIILDTILTAHDHRNEFGHLMQLEMLHMSCRAKFRIFEPVKECRLSCPDACKPNIAAVYVYLFIS